MSKELEDLLRRVSELEKLVKNGSFSAFGRSYSSIGSSSSDFVIKTKGLVKILWGNKFIDLIKDGKINVNSKFIYTVNTSDDIGNKDGIYVTSDNFIYLKQGDTVINLVGEVGTTYVSFMGELQTTPDQKYTALKNIGFLYSDLDSIDSNSLLNGIIYVESTLKLYIVYNGELTEFSIPFPTPYTKLFILSKDDSSEGALIIVGGGIENSIAFDTFYMYSTDQDSIFLAGTNFKFLINSNTIITISSTGLTSNKTIYSNTFSSVNSSDNFGFKLYLLMGQSTLEVDNIIVRNGISTTPELYPEYWWTDLNVVSNIEEETDEGLPINLKYQWDVLIGDTLYTYLDDSEEATRNIALLSVVNVEGNSIIVQSDASLDSKLINKIIFKVSVSPLIKNSKNGLDILVNDTVHTRIGNLKDLNLTKNENGELVNIEDTNGMFSNNGVFKKACYSSDYALQIDDNSSNLAPTEWVHKLLPTGSIIMFGNPALIPDGWSLCDGTNNTPNLVQYFIKDSTGNNYLAVLIMKAT